MLRACAGFSPVSFKLSLLDLAALTASLYSKRLAVSMRDRMGGPSIKGYAPPFEVGAPLANFT
jgi:hypothetical protein